MRKIDYQSAPPSKLYYMAEEILGESIHELRGVIHQLEKIKSEFAKRPIFYNPKPQLRQLRVVWPDD